MMQEWLEYMDVPSSKPTVGEAVFAYSPVEGMGIATLEERHRGTQWCWFYKRVSGSMLALGVTHWMPLPDPPKVD